MMLVTNITLYPSRAQCRAITLIITFSGRNIRSFLSFLSTKYKVVIKTGMNGMPVLMNDTTNQNALQLFCNVCGIVNSI